MTRNSLRGPLAFIFVQLRKKCQFFFSYGKSEKEEANVNIAIGSVRPDLGPLILRLLQVIEIQTNVIIKQIDWRGKIIFKKSLLQ